MTDVPGSGAYYQAHKNDHEEWGEAIKAPTSSSRRLATMVSARFASEEVEAIRNAAEAEGTSLSNFIRLAALAKVDSMNRSVRTPLATTTGLMTTIDNWNALGGTGASTYGRSTGQLQPL